MSVERGDGGGGGGVRGESCVAERSPSQNFFFFLSQSHLGKDQEDSEE